MQRARRQSSATTPTHAMRELNCARTGAKSQAIPVGAYSGNQAALHKSLRSSQGTQFKLAIGAVNDPLEAEADQVAEQVMRTPDPAVSSSSPALLRKCATCEQDEVPPIQKKQDGAQTNADLSPVVAQGTSGGGHKLDGSTRMFMESRFGRDFGNVRIHAGDASARSAQAVQAAAYTVGDRIVFAPGRYAPHTMEGRKLLAHELTHTVQQGAAGSSPKRVAWPAVSPQLRISNGAAPSIQRVGECVAYNYKTCGAQACIPNVGTGKGFCRWSGTVKNGCICIPIANTQLVRFVETVIFAALIAAGIVLALDLLIAAVACFASGACELAALIAVLGSAAAMIVVKLLGSSGGGAGASAPVASGAGPTGANGVAGSSGAAPPNGRAAGGPAQQPA